MTHDEHEFLRRLNRRQFFARSATGIGAAALASLLGANAASAAPRDDRLLLALTTARARSA